LLLPRPGVEIIDGLGLDEVERKLDGAKESGPHQSCGHVDAVRSEADVPDLSLLPRPVDRLQRPARPGYFLIIALLRELVDLKEVEVIGAQAPQAQVNIRLHTLTIALERLGGENQPAPDAVKGKSHFLFAVEVSIGRVEQGYPPVISQPKNLHRLRSGETDDGDATKTHLRDCEPCFSEQQITHKLHP
jgi:hypothetical protein